jgi:hypothetical protein
VPAEGVTPVVIPGVGDKDEDDDVEPNVDGPETTDPGAIVPAVGGITTVSDVGGNGSVAPDE